MVLAEGIEHEEHLTTARALGATLGQGWHFGRPDNLPMGEPAPAGIPTLSDPPPRAPGSSPCQIVGRPAGSVPPPSPCCTPSASISSTRPPPSAGRPW